MSRRIFYMHVVPEIEYDTINGYYYERPDEQYAGKNVYYRNDDPSQTVCSFHSTLGWILPGKQEAPGDYFLGGGTGDAPTVGNWPGQGEWTGDTMTVSAQGELPDGAQIFGEEEPPRPLSAEEEPGIGPPVLAPGTGTEAPPAIVGEEEPPRPLSAEEEASPISVAVEQPRLHRHYAEARGLYRVFNAPQFRIYRTGPYAATWPPGAEGAPPAEDDIPWDTCAALPYSPAGRFSDGVWFLALSYFNGCLDSGFYPVSPLGEPYLRLEIASGQQVGNPPQEPTWSIEPIAGGKARFQAFYCETGANRADQWALQLSTSGPPGDPVHHPPTTAEITGDGVTVWSYDTGAYTDETLYARLTVRRNDGTPEVPIWVYSPGTVKQVSIDYLAPIAPAWSEVWKGALPAET